LLLVSSNATKHQLNAAIPPTTTNYLSKTFSLMVDTNADVVVDANKTAANKTTGTNGTLHLTTGTNGILHVDAKSKTGEVSMVNPTTMVDADVEMPSREDLTA